MARADFVFEELKHLESIHQRRVLKSLEHGNAHEISYQGRTLVNFSSNDYLGLASHPRVKAAAQAAIEQFHASAASSRLICGNLAIHERLESRLAHFKQREAALVFSSGYLANLGILTALTGENDQVFSDALNHASIVDGCRLSRARIFVYRHLDLNHLESLLRGAPAARRRLLVSDAVFSMDGDVADLPGLAALAAAHDCLLMLDEAHATGVLGSTGRGIAEHFAERGQMAPGKECVDLAMGTLSKALGSFGGFVACSSQLREFLINKARSFIFSTALPPSAAGAALESLQLIGEEPFRREALWKNLYDLKGRLGASGFDVTASETPILPVTFGEEATALRMSERLVERGCFVPAIRPPSVPKGTSRLRITLSASHSSEDVVGLAKGLSELAEDGG
ncbi:MAG: 8-amino-7-oxononanoate synthase [Acidobacteria bacterium]|nr:8-amino-7-oxononanoate synthase [Acidobacteriota bacterium]MCI0625383.1 8-amino-7-oxononanoate synthase [Acidobacteriota bacterium]MCI0721026.1 8-amino-7-oxononanoate synthase [Acidobacteriota bacterium]